MELEQQIDNCITIWERDNCWRSDINLKHSSYKELVQLGKPAVPALLRRLGASWIVICALHDITGEEIVDPDIAGMFDKINDVWKNWGQEKGLI